MAFRTFRTSVSSGMFWANKVKTLPTDDLAPCVARSSAAKILIFGDQHVFVFLEGKYQPPVMFQLWWMIWNANTFSFFFQKISVYEVQSVSVILRLITLYHGWWWPGSARSPGIIIDLACPNTVQCHYNMANFLPNYHPWGWVMGWLLWVWSLIYVLLLSMPYVMLW